jgi:4-diphosphocytidyl-2-C-methyl-D-erythritol kinase
VNARLPALRALAPAKINLGLFLGPVRATDSRHELVTVMQSISLADELTLEPAPGGGVGDELVCPGVPGPAAENLAARALREFRARTGWQAPPLRLTIEKRIPLAAGLAGGSADAAATLRLARAASGLGDEKLLLAIAEGLGADVPAQVSPGRWLATGAGERLQRLPPPAMPFGVLVAPAPFALATADVYAEADRLGLARGRSELAHRREELASALAHGAALPAATELLHNDLQRAAVSLHGGIAEALRALGAAGARPALVSGSGPTVIGLFARPREEGFALARLAAQSLSESEPAPVPAVPVEAVFGEPQPIERDAAGGD